jgi:hypothetical protein
MSVSGADRHSSRFRRDLNSLWRNEKGELSSAMLGTTAGQVISGVFLWEHMDRLIDHWDSLTVLFLVLIAPEAYKKFMYMRFGGNNQDSFERTTTTSSSSSTSQGKDKPDVPDPR